MSEIDEQLLEEARQRATTAVRNAQAAEEVRAAAQAAREQAEAERDQAIQTFAEWKENAPVRKRTAELADQKSQIENWNSLQTTIGNAIPDFSDIKRGELVKPDDKVMFATLLKAKALADAADRVRSAVHTGGFSEKILVTADPHLLERDALRIGLQLRLQHLADVLSTFPGPRTPAPKPEEGEENRALGFAPADLVVGAATAAAKVIPQLFTLFAAHRKLTAQDLSVEDQEAVFAVAASLVESKKTPRVVVDSFRFLTDADSDPTAARSQPATPSKIPAAFQARDALEAALIDLQVSIARESVKADAAQDASWLTAAKAVAEQGLEALAGADTIPAGSTMSPLTAAVAMEAIRVGDFDAILLVTVTGATAVELTSDRAAAFKDRLHAVGTVALSFSHIERETSAVRSGGTVYGQAQVVGRIGSTIDVSHLAAPAR